MSSGVGVLCWSGDVQYLLTQEEYQALQSEAVARSDEATQTIQTLCTLAANHVPVAELGGKPWGCIITRKSGGICDSCPVETMCLYKYKRWSK